MVIYQLLVLAALLGIANLVRRNLRDYRTPNAHVLLPADPPHVSILVPARNEAENIESCLEGLLAQDYPAYDVLVLDDFSTDDTAERVERLMTRHRRLFLVRGAELPPGWAGKAHACWQLAQYARGEWLLFLDADTLAHAPDLLANSIAEARRTKADLLSTFPQQKIGSLGEALTVPMIFWLLFTLLPIGRVMNDRNPAFVAACGQFLLVRRKVYLDTGGHAAIRSSLHDGLHLARQLKQLGYLVALVDLSALVACRMYHGWAQCWAGFSRNTYQALGAFKALVIVSSLELTLFLLPFWFFGLGLLSGWPRWTWLALLQVLALYGVQNALRRRFNYPRLTVLLHPICVSVLLALQWTSWWRTIRRSTVDWKGRKV